MNLNDIAEINPKIDVGHLDHDALVSFVPMSDLSDDGRWIGCDSRTLRQVRHGYTAFAEHDILFAKITPCMENGKGARLGRLHNGIGFGSTEYHVLRARSEAEAEYVFQWSKFRELRAQAANSMTGSAGQQRVPADFLRKYPIFDHKPSDRVVIGEVLGKLDHAIAQSEALLKKQERIRTGLIHDLLTRGLDVQGQLRPSVEEANDLYWNSPVGWIPKDWSVNVLSKWTARITVGLATSVTKYYRDSGTRMIRNLNIRSGYFEGDDMVYLDPDFAARFPTKLVQERDVLTCRTGSNVGDTCLVPAAFAGSHTFTTLITTTIHSKLVPEFLVDYMASEIGTRELGNILVGAGKENLNARQLAFLRVRRPPPTEQEQIHQRIEAAKDSLNRMADVRDKLIRLKTGLMNDLLTARVPVTPLLPNFKD